MSMNSEPRNTAEAGARVGETTPGAAAHDPRGSLGDCFALGLITFAVIVLHMFTNGRFGFHRDELQVVDDARHLAWGFVAMPPVTPFLARVCIALFGAKLVGVRVFVVVAHGAVVLLTGLMARELGAGRVAQILAALAAVIAPMDMFGAKLAQYSSLDILWWVLIAYLLIRLLKSGDACWWMGIGAVVGIGLLTKYTMAFYAAGILGGLLLTSERRYLKSRWIWYGAGLAFLIFLPNLIWQAEHGFVSLHFLQFIHKRDVGEGRADGFVLLQFLLNSNIVLAPLWLAGLWYFLASGGGKRYRMLGWLYMILVILFFAMKGRGYYTGGLYPMLFAGGSILWERWVQGRRPALAWTVRVATFAAIALGGFGAGRALLPLGRISPENYALKMNGELREEIGWNELVSEVARVRDSLTPAERAEMGILTGNYGETGAIDWYGPKYGLPEAISGMNSAWYRGYGDPAPQTLIVVGYSRDEANEMFQSCRLAGHNGNPYGIHNEENDDHPGIFVCGAPREPWPAFWKNFRHFG